MAHISGTEVASRPSVPIESTSPPGGKAPFFSSSPSKSSSEMVTSDAVNGADSLLMRLHKGRSVSLATLPARPVPSPPTTQQSLEQAKREKKDKKKEKKDKADKEKERKAKEKKEKKSTSRTSVPTAPSLPQKPEGYDKPLPKPPVSASSAGSTTAVPVSPTRGTANLMPPPPPPLPTRESNELSSTDVTPRTSPSSSTHTSPRPHNSAALPPQPTIATRVVPPLRPTASSGSIMSPPASATSSSSPLTVSSTVQLSPKHLQTPQQPAIVLTPTVSDTEDGEDTATASHTADFASREAPDDDDDDGRDATADSSQPTTGRRHLDTADDGSGSDPEKPTSDSSSPVTGAAAITKTPSGSSVKSSSSSLTASGVYSSSGSIAGSATKVKPVPSQSDSDSSSSGQRRYQVSKQPLSNSISHANPAPPQGSSSSIINTISASIASGERAVSSAPATPTKSSHGSRSQHHGSNANSSSSSSHSRSRRDSLGQSRHTSGVSKSTTGDASTSSPSSSSRDPTRERVHREHGSGSRSGSRSGSKTRSSGVHSSSGGGTSSSHHSSSGQHRRDGSHGHTRHPSSGERKDRVERDSSRSRARRHSVSATNNKELLPRSRSGGTLSSSRSAKSSEDLAALASSNGGKDGKDGKQARSPKQVSPRSPKSKSKDRQSGSTIGKIDSSIKALTSFGFGISSTAQKRTGSSGSIGGSPMRLERRESGPELVKHRDREHHRDRERDRERERERDIRHRDHDREREPDSTADTSSPLSSSSTTTSSKIQQQRSWGKNSSSLSLVADFLPRQPRSRSGSQLNLKPAAALDPDAPLPPLPTEELAQELDDVSNNSSSNACSSPTQTFDYRDEAHPDETAASVSVTPAELLTLPPLDRILGSPDALLETLFARNMALVGVLMDASEFDSGDSLSSALVCLFESSGRTTQLLTWALRREVALALRKTSSLALFREDNSWNRLISVYCKQMCRSYFQRTLQRLMRRLAYERRSYEVDPNRLNGRKPNTKPLRELTQLFLQQLLRSESQFPPPVRFLCYYLRQELAMRFPSETLPPIGAFLFLRLICPALIMPTQYGILEKEPTDEARRTLILVAKVLQNLANGVQFGEKEAYMLDFNDILNEYTDPLKLFLQRLTSSTGVCALAQPFEITREQSLSAQNTLRQFIADRRKAIDDIITRKSPRATAT